RRQREHRGEYRRGGDPPHRLQALEQDRRLVHGRRLRAPRLDRAARAAGSAPLSPAALRLAPPWLPGLPPTRLAPTTPARRRHTVPFPRSRPLPVRIGRTERRAPPQSPGPPPTPAWCRHTGPFPRSRPLLDGIGGTDRHVLSRGLPRPVAEPVPPRRRAPDRSAAPSAPLSAARRRSRGRRCPGRGGGP